jgi:hypothetical protein
VRIYNRQLLVDIRETYLDQTSGEMRPGKKGIALRPEHWQKLLDMSEQISAAVRRLQS